MTTEYLFPIKINPLTQAANQKAANTSDKSNIDYGQLFKPSANQLESSSTLDPDVANVINNQSGGKIIV